MASRDKRSSYSISSLADLLNSGADADEIWEQLDSVYNTFPATTDPGNDFGSDEKWRRLTFELCSYVYCLIYNSTSIVGYWSCFPVTEELYRRGVVGENINLSMDTADINEFGVPGNYLGYFCDLYVLKSHRNLSANPMLFRSFMKFLSEGAKRGYFFERIFAHTSSEHSIRLCLQAGFDFRGDHTCHKMLNSQGERVPTKIHELELSKEDGLLRLDPNLRKTYAAHFGAVAKSNPANAVSATRKTDTLPKNEDSHTEFKSSLRANLITNNFDPRIELAVMKTIAGFFNASGGTLFIGVNDDGEPIGLSPDKFSSEDKMARCLKDMVRDKIGKVFMSLTEIEFHSHEDCRIMSIKCEQAGREAWIQDGATRRFYIRAGSSTEELVGNEITDYVRQRFR